ncbi:MAG: hypothetical protein IMZ52_06495 [Actinobacteria bacterium]|nr:hypothetical protein [Actinomycetota bacterium]
MLEKSISKYGYVTPMTAAADGTILDGNARLERVGEQMPADPIVIHHDGTRPIIAVRDDIPDGKTKVARAIAIAANRVGEIDLEWSPEEIASAQIDGVAIDDFFNEEELSELDGGKIEQLQEKEIELKPYQKVHILISIDVDKIQNINDQLDMLRKIDGVEIETKAN